VSGSGTTNLTISGSLTQVNDDLATLTDTDGTIVPDTIAVNASDSFGNTADEKQIAVTVKGVPVINAPGSVTVGVNQAKAITGLSLSESGNTTGETFTVMLADTNGDLSASGSSVSGAGTTGLTITGSLAEVNSDLATLTDTDSTTPSDTITLDANDSFGNTFSARPGERIAVKVSSQSDHPYRADLVRIIHADANPAGPGIKLEEIAADFAGAYVSRFQPVHLGSCGVVTPAEPITLPNPCTIVVRVQPWLLDGRPQTVMAIEGGPVLSVAPEGARLGLGGLWAQIDAPMLKGRWYELRLIANAEQLRLRQIALQHSWGVTDFGSAEMPGSLGMLRKLTLGAASTAQPGPHENPCCCFFNGLCQNSPARRKYFPTR
jgi:hypothetical protein